ncbi:restriction endonuclease subunit S [Roseibacillus persicicus]|uniref:restriction endonuclease subunit S n=1 Tax=Roseibacillus persicicus TaxID=454148 RepID=UPI00280F7BB7|nr:restriction endonuclease subunit S [Roseibacillus persicicus]MDQ8192448.1 restriction endonuclease subunit S [Roseibacillus persicicus]
MIEGKYKAYEEYLDSGVSWVGNAPSHWETLKFKHAIREKRKILRPDLPAGSISFGNVILKSEDALSLETKSSYQEVLAGEFLLNPLNLNYDVLSLRTALSKIDVVVSTGYMVLHNGDTLHPNFLRWLLHQFDVCHMKTLGAGVRQTVNFNDIGNSEFSKPSLPEQIQIARFLDHETGKIDLLIEKQQELIALLKEKRQAVISHAVTKGLNPQAPLKDSGIEWLGQVPEHWNSGKTKFFADLRTGHTPSRSKPEYWKDCYIPWFSLADVWQIRDSRNVYLDTTKEKISQRGLQNSAAELLPAGTVILSRTASVGFSGIMPKPMATTQDFVNWIPRPNLTSEYLLFVFRAMERVFESLKVGSTHKTIYMPDVLSFTTPIPPINEQNSIVSFVKKSLAKLDKTFELAESQITLLQERRTALISAAVTGKIDVRDWEPPSRSQS